MLHLWLTGPLKVRLSAHLVRNISCQLIEMAKYVPNDLNVKIQNYEIENLNNNLLNILC